MRETPCLNLANTHQNLLECDNVGAWVSEKYKSHKSVIFHLFSQKPHGRGFARNLVAMQTYKIIALNGAMVQKITHNYIFKDVTFLPKWDVSNPLLFIVWLNNVVRAFDYVKDNNL